MLSEQQRSSLDSKAFRYSYVQPVFQSCLLGEKVYVYSGPLLRSDKGAQELSGLTIGMRLHVSMSGGNKKITK